MRTCIVTSALLLGLFAQSGFAQTTAQTDAGPALKDQHLIGRFRGPRQGPATDILPVSVIGPPEKSAEATGPRGQFADVIPNREVSLGQPLADQLPAGRPLPDQIRGVPPAQGQIHRLDPGIPIFSLHPGPRDRGRMPTSG